MRYRLRSEAVRRACGNEERSVWNHTADVLQSEAAQS